MKLLKFGLRFWITLGSVFSFLVGWVIFGHSLRPVQPVSQASLAPLPTLEPLPPMGSLQDSHNRQFNQFTQPSFSSRPMFMTSGS
ncbi:MAG: hypothetical protein U0X74_02265 [Anaerolineales bacterium]